jgi:predicted nucleic acid-binding protein
MSGKEILVDTNIISYLLDGSDTLVEVLQGKDTYLSFITELELIVFKNRTPQEEQQIIELIGDCSIISMNSLIKDKYVQVRKKHSLKLADAVIAATALAFDMPLITADKQFKIVDNLKLITYQHGGQLANRKK